MIIAFANQNQQLLLVNLDLESGREKSVRLMDGDADGYFTVTFSVSHFSKGTEEFCLPE